MRDYQVLPTGCQYQKSFVLTSIKQTTARHPHESEMLLTPWTVSTCCFCCILLVIYIVVCIYAVYVVMLLSLRWDARQIFWNGQIFLICRLTGLHSLALLNALHHVRCFFLWFNSTIFLLCRTKVSRDWTTAACLPLPPGAWALPSVCGAPWLSPCPLLFFSPLPASSSAAPPVDSSRIRSQSASSPPGLPPHAAGFNAGITLAYHFIVFQW